MESYKYISEFPIHHQTKNIYLLINNNTLKKDVANHNTIPQLTKKLILNNKIILFGETSKFKSNTIDDILLSKVKNINQIKYTQKSIELINYFISTINVNKNLYGGENEPTPRCHLSFNIKKDLKSNNINLSLNIFGYQDSCFFYQTNEIFHSFCIFKNDIIKLNKLLTDIIQDETNIKTILSVIESLTLLLEQTYDHDSIVKSEELLQLDLSFLFSISNEEQRYYTIRQLVSEIYHSLLYFILKCINNNSILNNESIIIDDENSYNVIIYNVCRYIKGIANMHSMSKMLLHEHIMYYMASNYTGFENNQDSLASLATIWTSDKNDLHQIKLSYSKKLFEFDLYHWNRFEFNKESLISSLQTDYVLASENRSRYDYFDDEDDATLRSTLTSNVQLIFCIDVTLDQIPKVTDQDRYNKLLNELDDIGFKQLLEFPVEYKNNNNNHNIKSYQINNNNNNNKLYQNDMIIISSISKVEEYLIKLRDSLRNRSVRMYYQDFIKLLKPLDEIVSNHAFIKNIVEHDIAMCLINRLDRFDIKHNDAEAKHISVLIITIIQKILYGLSTLRNMYSKQIKVIMNRTTHWYSRLSDINVLLYCSNFVINEIHPSSKVRKVIFNEKFIDEIIDCIDPKDKSKSKMVMIIAAMLVESKLVKCSKIIDKFKDKGFIHLSELFINYCVDLTSESLRYLVDTLVINNNNIHSNNNDIEDNNIYKVEILDGNDKIDDDYDHSNEYSNNQYNESIYSDSENNQDGFDDDNENNQDEDDIDEDDIDDDDSYYSEDYEDNQL